LCVEQRAHRGDPVLDRTLDEALLAANPKPLRVDVPALSYDVHDLRTLAEVANVLAG